MTSTLPDKPSELLEVALRDLTLVENNPAYIVNMGEWHYPRNTGCSVCFAGAVMAGTLEAPVDSELTPEDFGDDEDKLRALDYARSGEWADYLDELGFLDEAPDALFDELPSICPYIVAPKRFKADISKAIDVLRSYGY